MIFDLNMIPALLQTIHLIESYFKKNTISPNSDIITIQGDWNATVGIDAHEAWTGTIGKYGLGETNDRGFVETKTSEHV